MTPTEFQELLTAAGLNQSSAARALEVDRRTVIRWLKGETPITKRQKLLIKSVIRPKK